MPDADAPPPIEVAKSADIVGNPRTKGVPLFTEIGTSGLQHSSGFVREEFLPQLQGDRALRVYREMKDNDPVIGGILFAIDMLMRQVAWRVEPAEASSVEAIVAEREDERRKALMAAQQAEFQTQQMQALQAHAAAQLGAANGAKPGQPGKPGAPTPPGAKKPAAKPSPAATTVTKLAKAHGRQQIRKTMGALGIDPDLYVDPDWFPQAADAASPFTKAEMGQEGPASGPGGNPPAKGLPAMPGKPPTPPPSVLDKDPVEAAKVEGEEWAVFVETCLADMSTSWEDTLSEILTMLPFGFHVAEPVYKKRSGPSGNPRTNSKFDDGKIGWRRIAGRAQETRLHWKIDPGTGAIEGFVQMDPSSGKGAVTIPAERMLLFRTKASKSNPEGTSVLRTAYRPWYFKKRIEEIEAIGIERDLAGLPVAHVPADMLSASATDAERATLAVVADIVRGIKRDEQEGVIFPLAYDPETGKETWKLELLSSGGQRQFDTDKTLARYDQRMAMCVLADFILLGHENVGSHALGKTKADLFTTALEAWLDAIADVFNTYAIPRLMRLNGQDPAMSPKLTHGSLSQVDLSELGQFLLQLSQAGAPLFPDDSLEDYVRDVAGLPGKEESASDV